MKNKFKSIKNLLLIWIVIIITAIVFMNKVDWLPLVQNLAWAVLGYFGANVAQDKIFADKDKLNNGL
ncbi:MAG: hypothetical protein FWD14_01875 [Treponema sp.]|nr:hypothetical protein [Treponema sp.]